MASSSPSEVELQKNKKVVREFFETENRGDIEGRGQFVSSTNYFFRVPGNPPMDRNTHKQFAYAFFSGFPDLRHEIVDMVVGGDKVAVRYDVIGRH